MIVSYGWTTDAFIAGWKTCTRRDWSQQTVNSLLKAGRFDAWSSSPRVVSKHPVALAVCSVESLTYEPSRLAPGSDYYAEGFAWLQRYGYELRPGLTPLAMWDRWRSSPNEKDWVLRFRVVSLTSAGLDALHLIAGSGKLIAPHLRALL